MRPANGWAHPTGAEATDPRCSTAPALPSSFYGKFGYELGRTVPAQAGDGRELIGKLSDLQKGDLLIFATRANKRRMGHAGIFIGLDSTGTNFQFIHAAVHGGIQINNLKETYYRDRFLGARRLLPDFVPEPAVDSLALAALEQRTESSVVPARDTLLLSPADRRIILFADGTWAVVDSLGGLSVPSSKERLVLAEGGAWHAVTPSTVRIPDLRDLSELPLRPARRWLPPRRLTVPQSITRSFPEIRSMPWPAVTGPR